MSNQNFGSATAVSISGTLTGAAQTVVLDLNGSGGVGLSVTGTWVGTIIFEAQAGDGTFTQLDITPANASSGAEATTAVNGLWTGICGGLAQFRVRAQPWTSGTANIEIFASPSSGLSRIDGAVYQDSTAFDPPGAGVPAYGKFDDVSPSPVSENEVGVLRMSSRRELYSQIRDAAGNERGANVNASNALEVAVVSGGSIGQIEGDVAHDLADSGNPVKTGARARSSLDAAVSVNDRVDAMATLTGGMLVAGVNGSNLVNLEVSAGGNPQIAGDVAHDINDTGNNPVKTGGRARTTAITAVSTNDRVDQIMSTTGGAMFAGSNAGVPTNVAVNGSGNVQVDIVSGGGSGGTALADEAGFTEGTTQFTPVGGVFNETNTDVTEDQAAAFRMTANRSMHSTIRDAAGNARGANVTASNALVTDGSAVTQPVSAASLPLPSGAATSALQLADGHNVTIDNASGGAAVNIQDGGNAITVDGDVAHDSPDSGGGPPIKIGHVGVEHNTDPPTISTDDDRVNSIANPQGMPYTATGHPNSIHEEYMTTGLQTNSILIPTVAAGSQIILFNIGAFIDADTTATAVKVRIGFGASAVPTEPTTGNTVAGMALTHPGIAPGSGAIESERKVGGDGEELRLACDAPTGGQLTVRYDYYISTL